MKIALYARVNTTDQDCSMQLREMHEYASRNGFEYQDYMDKGMSGTKANRPALKRLMADARLKRFDAVVTWKPDRFGRSLQQLIENVQLPVSYGVRFISLTQGYRHRSAESLWPFAPAHPRGAG